MSEQWERSRSERRARIADASAARNDEAPVEPNERSSFWHRLALRFKLRDSADGSGSSGCSGRDPSAGEHSH